MPSCQRITLPPHAKASSQEPCIAPPSTPSRHSTLQHHNTLAVQVGLHAFGMAAGSSTTLVRVVSGACGMRRRARTLATRRAGCVFLQRKAK